MQGERLIRGQPARLRGGPKHVLAAISVVLKSGTVWLPQSLRLCWLPASQASRKGESFSSYDQKRASSQQEGWLSISLPPPEVSGPQGSGSPNTRLFLTHTHTQVRLNRGLTHHSILMSGTSCGPNHHRHHLSKLSSRCGEHIPPATHFISQKVSNSPPL